MKGEAIGRHIRRAISSGAHDEPLLFEYPSVSFVVEDSMCCIECSRDALYFFVCDLMDEAVWEAIC